MPKNEPFHLPYISGTIYAKPFRQTVPGTKSGTMATQNRPQALIFRAVPVERKQPKKGGFRHPFLRCFSSRPVPFFSYRWDGGTERGFLRAFA